MSRFVALVLVEGLLIAQDVVLWERLGLAANACDRLALARHAYESVLVVFARFL